MKSVIIGESSGASMAECYMRDCIALAFLPLALGGCSSYRSATVAERERISFKERIYKIETTAGDFIDFTDDLLGYAVLKSGGIERFMPDGSVVTIPFTAVKRIYTMETTVLSSAGIIILIGAVVAALLSSCWAISISLGCGDMQACSLPQITFV
jgi:hypothetical protein